MATRLSRASGDWTAAGTWGLIDSTSYNNSESTTTVLTTSYQLSSTFTPGAITVAGILLKLSVRTGTTGTLSACLDQGGSDVAGTTVTINVADLPACATADLNGGWVFLKFSSPVTLLAATLYSVKVKTSSSSQVSLFATSGTNWARGLVTTTTGAPAAGDDVIIGGEYLSAGSSNDFTVTMDETASTDYGAASTSLVTPAIAICSKGTLTWGTTASTNYQLKVSGNLIIYSGGAYNQGSVGAECPRNSSMDLYFDCASNVGFGLTVRNLGTLVAQGLSRSSGKNIFTCKLNTNEAANQTTLGVDTDTGWLDNDEIAIASTTRTASQCESGALNGNAGASSLTVDGFAGAGGGLANAHSGTSPTQAEVILLTRNVKIRGASASLQAYIDIKTTATVDMDWVEMKWLGSATSNKRGIDCAVTTGSVNIQYCSMWAFKVTSSVGINMTTGGSAMNNYTISNNVFFDINAFHFQNSATSQTNWNVSNNIFMLNAGGNNLVLINDVDGIFSGNSMIGGAGINLAISDTVNTLHVGTISDNICHSGAGLGCRVQAPNANLLISNLTVWRNSNVGLSVDSLMDATFDSLVSFGNTTASLSANSSDLGSLKLLSPTMNGDTTFATGEGLRLADCVGFIEIINGILGVVSGIKTAHSTADIRFLSGANVRIQMTNTLLASTNEISGQTEIPPSAYISSQEHDQIAGNHRTWKKYGNIALETTTVKTGGQSIKLTPNNAGNKLECSGPYGGFKVAVANGQTVTPTVYVYENASYNGARARLIVKRNDALGITSDVVLDTATAASDAAWEALTGTTAAVTDDGTLEFVVDCDGTAGNLFVDSFSAA